MNATDASAGGTDALRRRLAWAVKIAREAGEITLRYFGSNLEVEWKADDSPVTVADREAESHLRRRIAEAFPEDGIVGEEWGTAEGSGAYRWILDPIDGTKSFIHGVPLYGTLIGIVYEDRAVAGVARIPALDEGVYAAEGMGAWYVRGEAPPRPARVSSCDRLAEAAWVTSEVANFDHVGRRDAFFRLQEAARLVRTWGDAYGYLLVATGRVDFMIDPLMQVWDAAAVAPIIREAGGRFSDWKGVYSFSSGNGLGSNGLLHEAVLAVLAGTPPQATAAGS
ncbi:MAG: histidinol-phosphatase [Thermogutta sp.]|nr:histidinol-phosphatase [Thermogutta sp.]